MDKNSQINTPEITSLQNAINIMKAEVRDVNAQAYLRGLDGSIDYGIDGLYTQLLYINSNIHHWTGENARATKKFLRKWLKTTFKKICSEDG